VVLERLGSWRAETPRNSGVGTRSRCIAVSLARELKHAEIVATDISAVALDYARRNAARHGVAGQIQLLETSLLEACLGSSGAVKNPFDLIISNPPSVGESDAANLPREVREH